MNTQTKQTWEFKLQSLQLRTLRANWKAGEMVFNLKDLEDFISQERQRVRDEVLGEVEKKIIEITEKGFDCICKSYVEDYFQSLKEEDNHE